MKELVEGLFTSEHVIKESCSQNYEGKVLVIKPSWFNEHSRNSENQLFFATYGFGCSPSATGTAVFGWFLSDGEKARLERYDFLGVLDEECMPDWAKVKLYDFFVEERRRKDGTE